MYKEFFDAKSLTCSDKPISDFIKFLAEKGIYKKDKNGNYHITLEGKKCSDNDDYIHGNGQPFHERGDY
jgi:predicted transcriptional regulator